jgi:diguanylate cyclase (GGDEF)-like protein
MEAKLYLRILLKKWWIVIPTFLVTFTAGIVFAYTKTPVYSATTTYVVVPSSSFSNVKDFSSGLDMLGRRTEIANTFSEIASSRKIKKLAFSSLSLESDTDYTVNSELLAGTNIIEITVDGPDALIARDLANTIGTTMEEYVQGLYEIFTLILLDEATTPRSPISPRRSLDLALAAVFGLVLGGGLAFLSEYLATPLSAAVGVSIIDDETGVYNKEYFLQRLTEEMVRARRNRYPLSLAMMQVDNLRLIKGANSGQVRAEILHQVAMLADQYLREEDIIAHLGDDTFAFLLPDTVGENAKAIMEYLQTRVAWTPFQSTLNPMKFNLKGVVGIATYDHNGTSRDELVAQASRALQLAGVDESGNIYLISELTASGDDQDAE